MQKQDPAKIKMGKLEGKGDTTLQGTVILAIDPEAGEVLFFKDVVGELPESTVYLAAEGDRERSICLGELKKSSGNFRMPVPFGMDTTPYNTVLVLDKESEKDFAFARL
ncbi:MAG: hypothetical protein SVX43_14915 [Cyanobacteriota bacterium]|nr:hypothetical protein [Cyanobacteriota bacterium]